MSRQRPDIRIEDQRASPPPKGASPCRSGRPLSPSLLVSGVSVIFVCMGNICRSPMAASVLRSELAKAGLDHVEVSSAGTGDWHVGDPADRRAQAALAQARVPHRPPGPAVRARSGSTTTTSSSRWTATTSATSGAWRRRARARGRTFDSCSSSTRRPRVLDVPDPYYGSSGDFDVVLDLLEPACRGLVGHLQTAPDPSRRTANGSAVGLALLAFTRRSAPIGLAGGGLVGSVGAWSSPGCSNRSTKTGSAPSSSSPTPTTWSTAEAAAIARFTGQGKQVVYTLLTSGEAGIDGLAPGGVCAASRGRAARSAVRRSASPRSSSSASRTGRSSTAFPCATRSLRRSDGIGRTS